MTTQYEEYRFVRPAWAWAALAALCAFILGWGAMVYFTVGDAPRQWDFGQMPDTPGQSIYSSEPTPEEIENAPAQIQTLPEAQPRTTQEGTR